MVPTWAYIQVVLKVKVNVKGHVIRALLWCHENRRWNRMICVLKFFLPSAAEAGIVAVLLANMFYVGVGGACLVILVGALVVGYCRCRWSARMRQTPTVTRWMTYSTLFSIWTYNKRILFSWSFCRKVAVWLNGNALVSINEVTLRRARLAFGWVTVCGRVNHLGM